MLHTSASSVEVFPVMSLNLYAFIKLNASKNQFKFFKSLDIANINSKLETQHSYTHEFWKNEDIEKELMNYLKDFPRNRKAYDKQALPGIDDPTEEYLRGDYEELEVGFVDGLFAIYKLRERTAKTKEELYMCVYWYL